MVLKQHGAEYPIIGKGGANLYGHSKKQMAVIILLKSIPQSIYFSINSSTGILYARFAFFPWTYISIKSFSIFFNASALK